MISQFVSPYEHRLLSDLAFEFPEGTHAIGRLDDESEGLLLLTTDKSLTQKLLHPTKKHSRRYLVQVEKKINKKTLQKLSEGIDILIKNKGKYTTLPCLVNLVEDPTNIPPREPVLVVYEPHFWLEFILTEGKNRQIRKMCRAVKHVCKRLIRTRIEDLDLNGMKAGDVREMSREELFPLLKLEL